MSVEFSNANHFRQVMGDVQRGQKIAIIFYDNLAAPCLEPTIAFHEASQNPEYNRNMDFFSINLQRKDMDEILHELNVFQIPTIGFYGGGAPVKVHVGTPQGVINALQRFRPQ